jgi:hypothetical protein
LHGLNYTKNKKDIWNLRINNILDENIKLIIKLKIKTRIIYKKYCNFLDLEIEEIVEL